MSAFSHIPDLYIPVSGGGKFPKSTVTPARKIYVCQTAGGIKLMQLPAFKNEKPETPLALERKHGVTRVLSGPHYSADAARAALPEAKARDRRWGAITYGRWEPEVEKKEEKKERLDDCWPKKGDADFE